MKKCKLDRFPEDNVVNALDKVEGDVGEQYIEVCTDPNHYGFPHDPEDCRAYGCWFIRKFYLPDSPKDWGERN